MNDAVRVTPGADGGSVQPIGGTVTVTTGEGGETRQQPGPQEVNPSLPEGIKTQEELIAAYNKLIGKDVVPPNAMDNDADAKARAEAEKTFGKNNVEKDPATGRFVKKADPAKAGEADPAKANADDPSKNGEELSAEEKEQLAKFEPYTEEYTKTGTLSDESKAKAAKDFGVPVAAVEAYLAGLSAQGDGIYTGFYEDAGGKAEYKAFQDWVLVAEADGTLSAEEIDAYNDALEHSPQAARQLFKGLKAKYDASRPARDITSNAGNSNANVGGDIYQNWEQVKADMAKAEYRNDPAFRAAVTAKLGRSNI